MGKELTHADLKGMSIREVEEWQHLAQFGCLPGRRPYNASSTAPKATSKAEQDLRKKEGR